jgi:hypothetical protein
MKKPKYKNSIFNDFLDELKGTEITKPKAVSVLRERRYFLIVCEGSRTEPLYFEYFKKFLPQNFLETIEIKGIGDNTINVVQKAIELKNERRNDILRPNFDEVWAVFDKDDFPSVRFNKAVQLATQNKIKSGHSNQSFELWYVLHFQFLQTALHRRDYITILSRNLGFKYKKNDLTVVEYLFTNCNIPQAIKWAKQLSKSQVGLTPSKSCPSTQVYKLVKQLLSYTQHDA